MADKTIPQLDAFNPATETLGTNLDETSLNPGSRRVTWLQRQRAGHVVAPLKRVPFVYNAAGATAHVVSADCIGLVDLEAWGGGGSSSADGGTGTGAGGGYATRRNVEVAPADSLAVVVGAGGVVNAGSDTANPGVASKVSDATPTVLVEAGGGAGAAPATVAAGGPVTTGDFGIVGGPGSLATTGTYGMNGGASPMGGSGGAINGTTQPASQPGGGGGSNTAGQAGAAGRVIVWEYQV